LVRASPNPVWDEAWYPGGGRSGSIVQASATGAARRAEQNATVDDASRLAEYEKVISAVRSWARRRADVRAVAVVGSWARRQARTDSDLDLIILTNAVWRYVVDEGWITDALREDATVVRRMEWGTLTERRARLASGLEVEFGLASPTWASVAPLDAGTEMVVRGGIVPVVDPDDLLRGLEATVLKEP
jgi:predicted nucleotidyltransferase